MDKPLYEDLEFIEVCRKHLKRTWTITDGELEELSNAIKDCMFLLEGRTAYKQVDWNKESNRALLKQMVRYEISQALEYFENNFHAELVFFILDNDSEYYGKNIDNQDNTETQGDING